MNVTETICKSALSRSGIYGWVYALNPYRGCEHACRYCYAPNILHLPRASWGAFLEVKKNLPTILAKELKHLKPALVGISSVTDPYQKSEEQFKVTRYCLEQLIKFKFPVSIITKSPLIVRDIDLLSRLTYAEITITITTLDDQLSELLEQNAPPIAERLGALKILSEHGLNTYAFLGPLLPTLEPEQVPGFIGTLSETGVTSVMTDTLNLKPGIWQAVANTLETASGMEKVKNIFQHRLFQDKKYYPTIFSLIQSECKKNGLKYIK
jgi:DNA repair photolyase